LLNINHYFLEFFKKQFILILFNVLDQNYHTFFGIEIKKNKWSASTAARATPGRTPTSHCIKIKFKYVLMKLKN